ncbi:MAG: patatin family protein [Bacilli bacterium]|nr:patatin family protein [Bacilli bacterium]
MKEATSQDIALVLQGGGTRGAFTAGVLDVLMENGITFPYVIGTSAGALNGVNYLSGDIGRSKFVTTELISDKKFVSFGNLLFRGSIFNFIYLFHEVPKTRYPFNSAAFNTSPSEFVVATTEMKSGKTAYLEKGVCKEFYKALAATSSLPLLARPVDVEGELYLDGGVGAAIPFRKPIEEGFSKIVVIETRERGFRKKVKSSPFKQFLARCMYGKYKQFLVEYKRRAEQYNLDAAEVERLDDEGVAFVVYPEVPPEVKLVEKDTDRLLRLYEQGHDVMTRQLPRLKAFMKGSKHEQKR